MRDAAEPEIHARLDDIQMLRALAVLFVMVQHLNFNLINGVDWIRNLASWADFGVGVDLFFVISGFVIARGLIPNLRRAQAQGDIRQTLQRFWIRRIWRIWPAAWLWLALTLALSFAFPNDLFIGAPRLNAFASLAGILGYANLRFADSWLRFPYGTSFSYWSLSLEEQFYLVLPVVVLLARRRLPWVLAAIVIVQFPFARNRWAEFLRTDAMAWGVLLALWCRTEGWRATEPIFLLTNKILRLVMVALCLVTMARLAGIGQKVLSWETGGVAAISAFLVWLASYGRNYILPFQVLRRNFLWLGSRSYALYLVHVPTYMMIRKFDDWVAPFAPPGLGLVRICAAAIVVPLIAEMTYRLVEQPLRHHGIRLTSRSPIAGERAVTATI